MRIEDFDRSQLLDIVVNLSPITADSLRQFAYNCNRHDGEQHPLSMVPVECCICLDNVARDPHIKCLECQVETIVCIKCFKLGGEAGEHRRGHNYEIIDKIGPNVFDNITGQNAWGAYEDLAMLSALINDRLLQWWEDDGIYEVSRQRTVQEALNRLDRCFLRSQIGEYILDMLKKKPLKLACYNVFENQTGAKMPSVAHLNLDDAFERQLALFLDPFGVTSASIKQESDTDASPSQAAVKGKISPTASRGKSFEGTPKQHTTRQSSRHSLQQVTDSGADRVEAEFPLELVRDEVCERTPGEACDRQLEDSDSDSSCKAKKRSKIESLRRGSDAMDVSPQKDNEAVSPSSIRRRADKRVKRKPGGHGDTAAYFDDESGTADAHEEDADEHIAGNENDVGSSAADKIMSRRVSAEFRSNRREQLENAKQVASEAMRSRFGGRMRKSSLELSEALNIDGVATNKMLHKSSEIMSEERIAELRLKYPESYFFANPPKRMSREAVAKYDPDDLQIIGYMPLRDDYEHEYKHKAEHLINQIVFRRPLEDANKSDVEKFADVVKLACIQRYNRVLKARVAKRGAIVEHDIINEFLQIAKNNLSEKGKYNVFDEKYFNSKRKEDEYKQLFAKVRQVADRPTVNTLAKNIGRMETLMDQIDELRQLQQSGVETLKGKLKVDTMPPGWSKKRRIRKADSLEVKKANARWKRIIRWSKRQPDVEESYDEKPEIDLDD